MSTDKKNFETKKPDGRKLFAPFSVFWKWTYVSFLWIVGTAIYLWLCWWAIGLLASLAV